MLTRRGFRHLITSRVCRRNRGDRRAVHRQSTERLESRCLLAAAPAPQLTATHVELEIEGARDSAALGDVDGDGRPDLVISTETGVAVLRGNAEGTFDTRTDYAQPGTVDRVELRDLNDDGCLDLMIFGSTSAHANALSVRLHDGAGGFEVSRTFVLDGGTSVDRQIVDINFDGLPDILGVSSHSAYAVFGDGDGFFSSPAAVQGQGRNSITTGDFNGDGHGDIAYAWHGVHGLSSTRLGGQDRSFQSASATRNYHLGGIASGDFNADGRDDLVQIRSNGSIIEVAPAAEDGAFDFASEISLDVGLGASDLNVLDINEDGHLDIVTVNQAGHSVSVITGRGDGSFNRQARYTVVEQPTEVAFVDVDADGRLDILVWSGTTPGVTVRLQDAAGQFRQGIDLGATSSERVLRDADAADLNGDGYLEIVAPFHTDDTAGVAIFTLATSSQSNRAPVMHPVADGVVQAGQTLTRTVTARDFDGDDLRFSLAEEAPAGATIDPDSGEFSWQPDAAQVQAEPWQIVVIVTDNGTPALTDSTVFEVRVQQSAGNPDANPPENHSPDLDAINDEHLEEGTVLTRRLTASDPDGDRVFFVLGDGVPDGMRLNPLTGELTWQTDEFDGPGSFDITAHAYDGDGAFDTESFIVNVREVNTAPQFPATLPNLRVVAEEGRLWIYTIAASDSDSPANRLTYTLVQAPNGATIDADTGRIDWTPNEQQGGREFTFEVQASDDGEPELSVTRGFQVAVMETNQAPVLAAVADHEVAVGQTLSIPLQATDADAPVNRLVFSLNGPIPQGANISSEGVFTWTPMADQLGEVTISVRVSDDGSPELTDMESFTVRVSSNFATIAGTKFHDLDRNGERDVDEPALAGWTVFADLNRNGNLDDAEPRAVTVEDDPLTHDANETGQYLLRVPAGTHTIAEVQQQDGWEQTFPNNGLSTYLGGAGSDSGYATTTDVQGNIYLAGNSGSTDFPVTPGSFDETHNGDSDVAIAKFDPQGRLLYATYLGGSGQEIVRDIAVDAQGHLYLTGETTSTNLPTTNAFQPSHAEGNYDGFVAKLGQDGSRVEYLSYLGGTGNETPLGITVDTPLDASGQPRTQFRAYITGSTFSPDFPTTAGVVQSSPGGVSDVFVTSLNADGSLASSTYLGGSLHESGRDIAVDDAGSIWVTGNSVSQNFPTRNALQPDLAGGREPDGDAVVVKLTGGLDRLVWSSYLGGSADDVAMSISVNGNGQAIVAGRTQSADFLTRNAIQSTLGGGEDGFITKLSADGSEAVWSTYYGGLGRDVVLSGDLTADGDLVFGGHTSSVDLAVAHTLPGQEQLQGPRDGFAARLSADGQTLETSRYIGGTGDDEVRSIATGPDGRVYVIGTTASDDLAVAQPFQSELKGPSDAFLTRIDDHMPGTHTVTVEVGDRIEGTDFGNVRRQRPPAGITVAPTTGLETTEAGSTAEFTVVLNSAPTDDVRINLEPADGSEGRVTSSSPVFTPDDWNVPQTVTVTGLNDDIDDGDSTYEIAVTTVSIDVGYDGLESTVVVTNRDDDTAGILITESDGHTAVSEGGDSDTYSLSLTSQPTDDVVITIDAGEQLTVHSDQQPATPAGGRIDLTFTPRDWRTPQIVTVAAVDDSSIEGRHTVRMTHTAVSVDTQYDGRTVPSVDVTIEDNDTVPRVQFEVVYGDDSGEGFFDSSRGTDRQFALEYALSLWSEQLPAAYDGETVTILTVMDPLGGSATGAPLAGARPTVLIRNGEGLEAETWYGSALAEHLIGENIYEGADVFIQFNTSVDGPVLGDRDWYYGLDANSGDDLDFVTVAMHELAHGLNYYDTISSSGAWLIANRPGIWDRHLETGDGDRLTDLSIAQRQAALISNDLWWGGAQGTAGNQGIRPRLYAPTPFVPGSSTAHLDETVHENELMSPFYSGADHEVSDMEAGILRDMGWTARSSTGRPGGQQGTVSGPMTVAFLNDNPTDHGRGFWAYSDPSMASANDRLTSTSNGVLMTQSFHATTGRLALTLHAPADVEIFSDTGQIVLFVNGREFPMAGQLESADVRSLSVSGSAGDDLIDLAGIDPADWPSLRSVRVEGRQGDDIIFGTLLADRIYGGGGHDVIEGSDGRDIIHGNSGHDLIHGGAGRDRITGGAGDDTLEGGTGDDRVVGRGGNDVLYGDDGIDRLYGGRGDDLLHGNAGADRLLGGAGTDSLSGGTGDDFLHGQAGHQDQLFGGDGTDRLLGGFAVAGPASFPTPAASISAGETREQSMAAAPAIVSDSTSTAFRQTEETADGPDTVSLTFATWMDWADGL